MEKEVEKRLSDLKMRSDRDMTFTFSDFLSPGDASVALMLGKAKEVTLFGGTKHSERVIARFGDPNFIGYEIPFPITILKVSPLNRKFSDELTHRDFLGALMNLGIERDTVGDILIRENAAYIFVVSRFAEMIMSDLTRVKHTVVKTERLEEAPEELAPKTQEERLIVSSARLDGIIARLWHLSRSRAKELFSAGEVFINGKLTANESYVPKEGDIIVVRKFGKAIYRGIDGATKKGKQVVLLDRYVD